MTETLGVLLPIFVGSVIVFWSLPEKNRFGFLAAVSFGMLAYMEPAGATVLLGITVASFFCARFAAGHESRWWVTPILVVSVLSYLLYFKYVPSIFQALSGSRMDVAVPLGISYFSFKLIHYVVEVRRGGITGSEFSQFAAYIFLVPIFTAGPIERFDHFTHYLEREWKLDSMVEGFTRILHGVIKKFVIGAFLAHQISQMTNLHQVSQNLGNHTGVDLWIYALLTYLYIYMDFSAYCDMAIGASRLYGIKIIENFNWPVIATNIVEFWQRWHISLRAWCQSYIYLPVIAVSRMPYVAMYLTFITMGLGHRGDWTYVCWGIYHGTGVGVFQYWSRKKLRKRIRKKLPNGSAIVGLGVTNLFIAGSHLWSMHSPAGVTDRLRVLCKMVFFVTL